MDEPSVQNPKASNKTVKITVLAIIAVLIVIAVGYSGYYYGSQANKTSGSTQVQQLPAYHTVLSVGYPLNTSVKVTTKLAVPERLQAIAVGSTIQNPGYTGLLADNFNEEMGRWSFANPAAVHSGYGDLSLIHISDTWLRQISAAPDSPNGILTGLEFTTPAKKATSLTTLESQTKDCVAKNSGFVISKVLNVCYKPTLVRQASGVYSPSLDFKGYGLIDGQKYVLVGSVNLNDGTQYSEGEANKKGDDFMAGHIPQETQNLMTEYVNALKMTIIESSAK
jgi:hypothetical protein